MVKDAYLDYDCIFPIIKNCKLINGLDINESPGLFTQHKMIAIIWRTENNKQCHPEVMRLYKESKDDEKKFILLNEFREFLVQNLIQIGQYPRETVLALAKSLNECIV